MSWQGSKDFIVQALSEKGEPSCSRVLSVWLSISSMSLIWFVVRHIMDAPTDKLTIWLPNLPLLIGALAAFAVSPYGVSKLSGIWDKRKDEDKRS